MRKGTAFVEVSGSCFLPGEVFRTLYSALSLLDGMVNNGANHYSIEMADLTAGGLHASRK
jgi:hypothetical protein